MWMVSHHILPTFNNIYAISSHSKFSPSSILSIKSNIKHDYLINSSIVHLNRRWRRQQRRHPWWSMMNQFNDFIRIFTCMYLIAIYPEKFPNNSVSNFYRVLSRHFTQTRSLTHSRWHYFCIIHTVYIFFALSMVAALF